jgi:Tol biopolymer transport system component
MTRILITIAALGTLAALPLTGPGEHAAVEGAGMTAPGVEDVVVRRVYEGPDVGFWGVDVSPDGRYVTQWVDGSLGILDLVTGVVRTVPGTDGFVGMAAFSPDMERIAFMVWDEGQYGMRVVKPDGSENVRLLRGVPMGQPADDPVHVEAWPEVYGWSNDGSAVLAGVWASPRLMHVALYPIDGSPHRVLHRPPAGVGPSYAALSPDGRWLAFDQNLAQPSPERPLPDVDIYVMPVDGSARPISVAPHPGNDELIGWTDTGRLLLASDRELTQGVWSVKIRDGRPVAEPSLVKGDLWGIAPLDVEGSTVFYGIPTQYEQVHTIGLSLDNGRLVGPLAPVEPDVRPSSWPAWSPDGRYLAYKVVKEFRGRGGTEYELGVIRSAAGQEAQEIELEPVAATSRSLRWLSEDELAFRGKLRAEDASRGFAALDLGTGTARTLYMFDDFPCNTPEFHPDGQRLFCVLRDEEEQRQEVVELDLTTRSTRVVWGHAGAEERSLWLLTLSPDARRIAFWDYRRSSDAPGQVTWTLNLLAAEGGSPDEIFSFSRPEDGYTDCSGRDKVYWTPDGQQILIAIPELLSEDRDPGPEACPLYLVPTTGGDPIRIGALPEHGQWALSPDGTRLALVNRESRGEIWVLEETEGRVVSP